MKGDSLIKPLGGNTTSNKVLIRVKGSQRDAFGDENKIELFTEGRSSQKNDAQYVTYKETELSGLEGSSTLLKIYADHVILVRTGAVDQRQEFRLGKRSFSSYVTPFGTLEMSVLTTGLTIRRTADGSSVADINIEYELEIDKRWQSANKLSITVQGDKDNGH